MKPRLFALATILVLNLVLGATPFSMQAHAQGSIEDSPVWRVQLVLTTANVDGGEIQGGNQKVAVRLNLNNFTQLYSSFNNGHILERGRTYTYDLALDNVRKLQDIQMIQLYKEGSDSWCVAALTLLVNGTPIY